MTEIEIVKITNNRFNRVTTQTTKSILFHVKLCVDGNEPEYFEYGIQHILRNSVALRCAKNQSCKGRLSAKHKFETVEVGQSGKNKKYDFCNTVTSEDLKCSSNWSIYHSRTQRCLITPSGLCQHLAHNDSCTYRVSRDLQRQVVSHAVLARQTGNALSYTTIKDGLNQTFQLQKTVSGEERPALFLSDNGINLNMLGHRLSRYQNEKSGSESLIPDSLQTLRITDNVTDFWSFEYPNFIINCLPTELHRLNSMIWNIDATFKCVSRL